MKILIAEDDEASALVIEKFVSDYGISDVATDGKIAMELFETALGSDEPYDLLCLDIMMPHMDGHQVLENCRKMESEKGIDLGDGVKIIMTTCLEDKKNILSSFRQGCESYIVKPVTKIELDYNFKKLNL